jgi:hypothetical protein
MRDLKFLFTFFLIITFAAGVLAQSAPKIDFDKKVREATSVLPQTPVVKKLRSDAEDQKFKGKVKSVIIDSDYINGTKRVRSGEQYFDESGNLVKEISFFEGYPDEVTVWGYIDGWRVSKTSVVNYDPKQLPPYEYPYGRNLRRAGKKEPPGPRDIRFTNKYGYKYDNLGRIAETSTYLNNGKIAYRTVYEYKGNRMAIATYENKEWPVDVIVLEMDSAGNEVGFVALDGAGTPHYPTKYTYEFDAAGNWIVQKQYKSDTVNGKNVLIPRMVTYRTITYY